MPHYVVRTSPITGVVRRQCIIYDPLDHASWIAGELIQSALSYLTVDEREFLMTGISPEEWEESFGEDEE